MGSSFHSRLLGAAALAAIFLHSGIAQADNARYPQVQTGAISNKKGEPVQPTGFRSWVFIDVPLMPHGLTHGKAGFPELLNVNVEAAAFTYSLDFARQSRGQWS